MLRKLATLIVLLGAGPVAALAADVPYAPQTTYGVYRGGAQIGRHTIRFQQQGPIKVVTHDCEIDVKTLGVTSYRYVYRGREEWDGEQLQALQTSTDDNGQRFTVSAERRGASLMVERTAPASVSTAALMDQGYRGPDVRREALPAAILPTSQWNVRQVQQSSLLNTQFGTVSRVQVSPVGRETVQTGNSSVTATRYRYSGDLRMDQWFDDRGRWVKGTFTAFDGSTIEYILQE